MSQSGIQISSTQTGRPGYSVTSLMVYESCPLQYYYAYIRGIPPPRSPAMETGLSIHKLISDHFKRPALLPPEIEPGLAAMFDQFTSSRFNVPPLASEKPFSLPLTRGDVRGRIDLILPGQGGGLELVDFKSGTVRSRKEMESSVQLPLYALAASTIFDRDPGDVYYTYYFLRDGTELVFGGQGNGFGGLIERVEDTMKAIEAGKFDPSPGCTCYACRRERSRRRGRPASAR